MPKFTDHDCNRMAKELEDMSDLIHKHPEKNDHTSERLKKLAEEMRRDADSAYLQSDETSKA